MRTSTAAFALAFQDREQAISAYADWFFEWKRSYVVLKETIIVGDHPLLRGRQIRVR